MSKVNRIIFNGTELDLQDDEAVRHVQEELTEDQKAQARDNIDAVGEEDMQAYVEEAILGGAW